MYSNSADNYLNIYVFNLATYIFRSIGAIAGGAIAGGHIGHIFTLLGREKKLIVIIINLQHYLILYLAM